MRKLYLLLDEWNSDKNFVASELELIKEHFDVTVVCDDFEDKASFVFPEGVEFLFYKREGGLRVISALLKTLIDKEAWKEFFRLKGEKDKASKISEIIRFYINAELFYSFLQNNGVTDKNTDALFYSYWYFWKCFAITKHRKDMPQINVITRTHEYELFTVSIPSGYQPFKYAMDEKLDRIIFISKHGRDYYLDKYVNSNKNSVSQEEIDSKYLLYHLGTKDYGKLNPYVRGEVFNLVSCSSVIPRKRVGLILEALSNINDIKVHWVHFGDGELMSELRDRVRLLLDCKPNITYDLRGYTKHDDVMKYYLENSVDAFAMVAISEGNPVSVMEAMSFGIPIISYNICNMSNMIRGCGVLVSEDATAKQLSIIIEKMAVADDNTIYKYRENSRRIWKEEYKEDTNNRRFVSQVLL